MQRQENVEIDLHGAPRLCVVGKRKCATERMGHPLTGECLVQDYHSVNELHESSLAASIA